MFCRRFILLLIVLSGFFLTATPARAVVYQFNSSISDGDQVAVTVTLLDAPEGDAVDVQVSIPAGEGDILGVFGNVADEGIVSSLTASSGGIVTQSTFATNKVWKVGGGNNLNPAPKKWDWGVRIGDAGSKGGAVEAASFRLSAPTLTTAELLAANNGGWVLGVRIQSTTGSEGSAKIGLQSGVAPVVPPFLQIDSPPDGARLADTPVLVEGHVVGGAPNAVSINGVSAALGPGGSFSAQVSLVEGSNLLLAQAETLWGPLSDQIAVELDTHPLSITITSPADGQRSASPSVAVMGRVDPVDAVVHVNGVLATVINGRFVASAVSLVGEGTNTITATAEKEGRVASTEVTVVYDPAPLVYITRPRNGDILRHALADVEGTVNDLAALVDVNGVVASVNSSGHFVARDVPLELGENELHAQAVDLQGASSGHSITVTRDDTANPHLRTVYVDPSRYSLDDYLEAGEMNLHSWYRLTPWNFTQIAAANVEEFEEELNRLGFSPGNFTTDSGAIRVDSEEPNRQYLFAFSDEPGDVTFEIGPWSFQEPLIPVGELFADLADGLLNETRHSWWFWNSLDPLRADSEAQSRIIPQDFDAKYAAFAPVPLDCNDCPDELATAVFQTRAIVARTATGASEIPVNVDTGVRPFIDFDSPLEDSTVSDAPLTVTGRVFSSHGEYNVSQGWGSPEDVSPRPVFRTLHYRVTDSYGIITDEGLVPIADGRFVLPDLILPSEGYTEIGVNAFGASGVQGGAFFNVIVDANAPRVALLSPQDGSVLLQPSTSLSFNFSEPITLLTVNGIPDGRSFPAGVANDVLQVPLEYGENVIKLEFSGAAGNFPYAFTLYRVDSLEALRITSPRHQSWLNTPEIIVEGTAPLGTPYVEVNGVAAQMLEGGMKFRAIVPAQEGHLKITARNPLLSQTASIDVFIDTTAPQLLDLPPTEGTTTTSPTLAFGGAASEQVTVQVETGTFSWGGTTYHDDGFANLIYGENGSIYLEQADAYPFYAGEIPLSLGSNAVTITLTDFAGNQTVIDRTFLRREGILSLVAPAPGTTVNTPTVPLTLAANADLILETLYVGARRFPAYEGRQLAPGEHTLPAVLLDAGENEVRVLYHGDDGITAVANYQLTGVAPLDFLEGTITDQGSGEPLGGAQVKFTVNGVTFIVNSDAQGHFIAAVPPGEVAIEASAEGYASIQVSVPSSRTDPVTILLPEAIAGASENRIAIIVPPEGTVTDWDKITVVGNVIDGQSTVTVNGIAARVVGNRFTATSVPLAMGANSIEVRAVNPNGDLTLEAVTIERSDVPVPLVKIYSPPDGASIQGSGLVVRGFVSSRSDLITLHDREPASLQMGSEGVFEAQGVALPAGEQILSVDLLENGAVVASGAVALTVTSSKPALGLGIEPSVGPLPLFSKVLISAYVDGILLEAIDFDWDGDGVLDEFDAPVFLDHVFTQDRAYRVKAIVATQDGVEYAVENDARAYQPHAVLGASFAQGNPVDLEMDNEGRLYVLDGSAGRVRRFTQDGVEDLQFGEGLSNPQAMALGPDGKLYIADTGNHQIQIYGTDGQFRETMGAYGAALGEFDSPQGIAIDGTALVVADTGNQRVQRIELDGSSHRSFPLTSPRGVASDSAWGALLASPSAGLLTVSAMGTGFLNGYLAGTPSEGALVAPIDIAAGKDGFAVVDAASGSIVVLARGLGYRRVVAGLDARAVVFGARKTKETLFVADGKQVVEIDLPIPSPMPTFETFRQRLAAGDIDAVLELIMPINRSHYRTTLEAISADLPVEAADMEDAYLSRLTRKRALIMLPRKQEVQGRIMELVYPMYLYRGEDGQWRIVSY